MIGDTNYGELTFRGSVSRSAVEAEDPVLAAFEPHIVYDGTTPIFKIGDGIRPWSELPNLVGAGGGGGGSGGLSVVDNLDGTLTLDGTSVVDNLDGTLTIGA